MIISLELDGSGRWPLWDTWCPGPLLPTSPLGSGTSALGPAQVRWKSCSEASLSKGQFYSPTAEGGWKRGPRFACDEHEGVTRRQQRGCGLERCASPQDHGRTCWAPSLTQRSKLERGAPGASSLHGWVILSSHLHCSVQGCVCRHMHVCACVRECVARERVCGRRMSTHERCVCVVT